MKRILIGLAILILATSAQADIAGSFIQLHRDKAERSVQDWREDFRQIKALGGEILIVQWTAEEPMLYFEPNDARSRDRLKGMTEVYPVLERIFEAAEAEGMSLILGLQHHPEYWDQIKGREKVIRDFFRIRMARNERLQRALLDAFGERAVWTGYYIPDEVDDYTWRTPEMTALVRDYLERMTAILRANDPERAVSVSAFFRGRTTPDYVVQNFVDIMAGTGVDYLLLQDGVGVGDPPLPYVHLYYEAFSRLWNADRAGDQGSLPELWGVIETFKQVSGPDAPFEAVPAPADRLRGQVQAARPYFDRLILFTFGDYLHPDLGEAARDAYETLRPVDP